MLSVLLAAGLSAAAVGPPRFICPPKLTEPCVLAPDGSGVPVPEKARPPRDLRTEPYLRADETLPLILGGAGLDAWTALDLLERREAKELNPLGSSPGKIVALQFAHGAGGFAAVHIVDRRYGRKWGRRTLIGITAFKVAIAAVQLKQAR
jgi:hypothetical protein